MLSDGILCPVFVTCIRQDAFVLVRDAIAEYKNTEMLKRGVCMQYRVGVSLLDCNHIVDKISARLADFSLR